ncbi:hypothetical protein CHS0354_036619 [Potamilus streckersoni]|uniref:Uncharacterized protein n=1 Tax=Potamilus streckersoni TaxID=2493646 RepID=A0AAE0TG82_9BIVA|nr:hypothetical protein CHS0354_036619 [Potamilus streckersoni]
MKSTFAYFLSFGAVGGDGTLSLAEGKAVSCLVFDMFIFCNKQSLAEGKAVIDVKKIMDTWILQKNYPVVTVSLVNGDTIKVEQARFLINEEHRKNAEPMFVFRRNLSVLI